MLCPPPKFDLHPVSLTRSPRRADTQPYYGCLTCFPPRYDTPNLDVWLATPYKVQTLYAWIRKYTSMPARWHYGWRTFAVTWIQKEDEI